MTFKDPLVYLIFINEITDNVYSIIEICVNLLLSKTHSARAVRIASNKVSILNAIILDQFISICEEIVVAIVVSSKSRQNFSQR